jgi:hypothetical protein
MPCHRKKRPVIPLIVDYELAEGEHVSPDVLPQLLLHSLVLLLFIVSPFLLRSKEIFFLLKGQCQEMVAEMRPYIVVDRSKLRSVNPVFCLKIGLLEATACRIE